MGEAHSEKSQQRREFVQDFKYQAQKKFLYEIASHHTHMHSLSLSHTHTHTHTHTWEVRWKVGWERELLIATNPFSFEQPTALLSEKLALMPQENQKVLLGKERKKGGLKSL